MLGLATGSTPIHVYKELLWLHKSGKLSFANVVTYNLDEYAGLGPGDLQSYHTFMAVHLFDHLADMDPANVHIPDGRAADVARLMAKTMHACLCLTCAAARDNTLLTCRPVCH